MDRASRQRINKETMALNDTLDEMDLTGMFRTFHRKFSKTDHILGHKTALSKYKRIEIIPCTLSDHNAMKLEINHRKRFGKPPNAWR